MATATGFLLFDIGLPPVERADPRWERTNCQVGMICSGILARQAPPDSAIGRVAASVPAGSYAAMGGPDASVPEMTAAALERPRDATGWVAQDVAVLVPSRFSRGGSSSSPCTWNHTFSAMLVAWSPMRSMFLAMNSRCVHGVIARASSIM